MEIYCQGNQLSLYTREHWNILKQKKKTDALLVTHAVLILLLWTFKCNTVYT